MTGVVAIPSDRYHADDIADTPTLSSSIASLLCTATPLHAYTAHPKLNPDWKPAKDKDAWDFGTCAHALLLEGIDRAVVVDADSWRTNAAKEERDAARAAGQVPLLTKDWDAMQAMVAAVREQMARHQADPPLFTDGKPEQTIVWEEDGVVCRARIDWLRDDHAAVDDLKTTSRSANPDAYKRNLFSVGGDVQCAFYLRGLKRLAGVDAQWRWVVVETSPPFAVSVISPGPDVLALGEAKVEYAIRRWRECLSSGEWPGYPLEVVRAELPPWEEARWLERELSEAA